MFLRLGWLQGVHAGRLLDPIDWNLRPPVFPIRLRAMIDITFETHATTLDNEAGVASGHFDVALSPSGERQAGELARRYRGHGFGTIFCSDLQRAYRTAQLAFPDREEKIVRDRRLRECDYGDLTRSPRRKIFELLVGHLDTPFPGGESYRDAVMRVRNFLRDIGTRMDGETILIIGHRATHFALEHWLHGIPLEKIMQKKWHWQPGWKFVFDPAAEL